MTSLRIPLPNPVETASHADLERRILLALSLLGHLPRELPASALPWCELLRRALLGEPITALASEQVRG